MNKTVFRHEWKVWHRSWSSYALSALYFGLGTLSTLAAANYFDNRPLSHDQIIAYGTPFSFASDSFLYTKFLALIIVFTAGTSLFKDFRSGIYTFLYSYPVGKERYLNAKLFSVACITIIYCTFFLAGLGTGHMLLSQGINAPLKSFASYACSFGMYIIPNALLIVIFTFSTVGLFRDFYAGLLITLGLFLLPTILQNTLFNFPALLSLLDPFGQSAFLFCTKDWAHADRVSNQLPFNTIVIVNRLLWLFGSFLFYLRFRQMDALGYLPLIRMPKILPGNKTAAAVQQIEGSLDVKYADSITAQIKTTWLMSCRALHKMTNNWGFIILCLLAGFTVFFIQLKMSQTGELNTTPYTYLLLGSPLTLYVLICHIGSAILGSWWYSSARRQEIDAIIDVSPVRSWQLLVSTLGGLIKVQLLLLLLFMSISISIQLANGYYLFEIGLYLYHLFIITLPTFIIWNTFYFFVYNFSPNNLVGIFICICTLLGHQSLGNFGINTRLLQFNNFPALDYSALYGYGYNLHEYKSLIAYWGLFALLLFILTLLSWKRGIDTAFRMLYRQIRQNINPIGASFLAATLMTFVVLGLYILKLERQSNAVWNEVQTGLDSLEGYKADWGIYANATFTKIVDIKLSIDLKPEEHSFIAKGNYKLVNKHSSKIIDTVFVRSSFDESTEIDWMGQALLIDENKMYRSQLYKLHTPLNPLDTIEMSFIIKSKDNIGFVRNSNILSNGSLLGSDILPRLSYQFTTLERSIPNDISHRLNYYHSDADRVHLETFISTSPDQTPIAPGELISVDSSEAIAIYHYKTNIPVDINFSFHSGRYSKEVQIMDQKTIEIYHLPRSNANLMEMVAGLKTSLKYNRERFTPYPHQSIRVIECPWTETDYAATLMANNIPVNERLFQITNKAKKASIKLPFYILAHELTHEWFGNQLVPAAAEGAKMLTESLTEYITLCLYEESFGESYKEVFYNHQIERYRRGHNRETGEEPPLYKVKSPQQYIAYGKGSIAFYEISKAIGRTLFDDILQQFILVYRNSSSYPTSLDFINFLKRRINQQYHTLIDYWLTEVHDI